jgi:hypothetical protein
MNYMYVKGVYTDVLFSLNEGSIPPGYYLDYKRFQIPVLRVCAPDRPILKKTESI